MCEPSHGRAMGATTARTRRSLLSGQELTAASLLRTTCSLESRTPDQSCCRASTSVPAAAAPAAKPNTAPKRIMRFTGYPQDCLTCE